MTTASRSSAGKFLPYALLIVILLWTLVPVGWMLISSFKSLTDVLSPTPLLMFKPTLVNYISLVSGGNNVLTYFRSSMIAAGVSTIIATTLGCLAGYGLARGNFRAKKHLAFWIISTRMAPIAAIVLPLFILFRYVNLLDTIPGLVVAYLTFNLPFAIWIMNAFFMDLPPSLEEAAMVDGASRFQAFYRVALPLVTPGIVTTAILCLVFSWND
jgi:multiple sugar transport system permease protein